MLFRTNIFLKQSLPLIAMKFKSAFLFLINYKNRFPLHNLLDKQYKKTLKATTDYPQAEQFTDFQAF